MPGVLLALLSILVTNPAFYAAPRGWVAWCWRRAISAALPMARAGLLANNPDSYWKLRLDTGRVLHPWRAVALWAALVALSVMLIALNDNFVWLIWIPFGMSFSLLPMPRCLVLVVPTVLLAMAYYHATPDEPLAIRAPAIRRVCHRTCRAIAR